MPNMRPPRRRLSGIEQDEVDELKDELEDARDEIDRAQSRVDAAEDEVDRIEAEIDAVYERGAPSDGPQHEGRTYPESRAIGDGVVVCTEHLTCKRCAAEIASHA